MNGEKAFRRTTFTEDGAAILDTRSGQITTLNTTGALIWKELEQGKDPSSIASALAEATGQSLCVVEQDVVAFLAELKAHHLHSC